MRNFDAVHTALARIEDDINYHKSVVTRSSLDEYGQGYVEGLLHVLRFINDELDISDLVEDDNV